MVWRQIGVTPGIKGGGRSFRAGHFCTQHTLTVQHYISGILSLQVLALLRQHLSTAFVQDKACPHTTHVHRMQVEVHLQPPGHSVYS